MKKIFFMTFYKSNEFNLVSIFGKKQIDFHMCKEKINGYTIYINEKDIDDNFYDKTKISIDVIIDDKENNLIDRDNDSDIKEPLIQKDNDDSKFKIPIEFEQIENDITFLFNFNLIKKYYKHNQILQKCQELIINIYERWSNKTITNSDKFFLYFNYLLSEKKDIENNKNFYISLIKDFIKIEKNNFSIEIIICIFIVSFYENKFYSFIELKLNKENINFNKINRIQLIDSNFEFFSENILKCLQTLKNENIPKKDDLLEIIIIFFIKFKRNDIDHILFNNNNKEMILNVFKRNYTTFISEEILDKEIIQKFITNSPNLQYILNALKNCNNNNSYLELIEKNFDKIYNEINSLEVLKSLKSDIGKFIINCDISQFDNIDKFVKLHNSLFKKQSEKKKYFIDFNKIIQKYSKLYKDYNNITGLCCLEIMIFEELKYFPNIPQLKKLDEELIKEIKKRFLDKLNKRDLKDKDIIEILFKLKHHYTDDDNIFQWEEKKKILDYFIEKCQNNENKIINEYKEKGIYNLFSNNDVKNIGKRLKEVKFRKNNNFLYLIPEDKFGDQVYDIMIDLIIKVTEDNNIDPNDIIGKDNDVPFVSILSEPKENLLKTFLDK